ncbi:tRNA 4-thiouridine(8) synthase ThiI [Candidatus Microgenomates bacterium]|nr:tRNA 4-thiouridine(8) synthase ThiI [Candidatus Microgenomates bacterium]
MKKTKVLVLFSGGLDSLLAIKILKEKDYEVEAVHFQNPFSSLKPETIKEISDQVLFELHLIKLGNDYLRIIEEPKHGYGKRMNPCLDCRIFSLKKAWQLANKLGADFLGTGEVLGQRPFSQRQQAMDLIEKEAGLKNKILRPLIDLGIRGRSRKKQLALAQKDGLTKFSSPAGGCLLTDPAFAKKIKDFLENEGKLSLPMVELLKLGRHFRKEKTKIIIGRNKEENERLEKLAQEQGWWFGEVVGIPSPTGVVFQEKHLSAASRLVTYYSDAEKGEKVVCNWKKGKKEKKINILAPKKTSQEPL